MKNLKIPILYGIIIAVLLIAFFLLLSVFGLHVNPVYSIFNGVIMAVGLWFALQAYRKDKGNKFKYQKGFSMIFITGINATVIFVIFFGLYATEFNPGFLDQMINMWATFYNTNIGIVLFTIAMMGISTSVVLALAYMQLFKDSWNTKEAKKHTF
ncbi:DUF4199 domain-containing protein [Gramella sp. GC03-9]|uniref:DUF4199 domain-containing protein n=1 Tax=Christiangramia oceanisediminis TaxID=2920386 RepID=A0A9X2I1H7_9FLAO|nr:DUF4199 domain-containing protein [Gramella oceanisediminis]MCP9198920.1 DUF4199 domain-containing protein [Gramella oceanisediminis]